MKKILPYLRIPALIGLILLVGLLAWNQRVSASAVEQMAPTPPPPP